MRPIKVSGGMPLDPSFAAPTFRQRKKRHSLSVSFALILSVCLSLSLSFLRRRPPPPPPPILIAPAASASSSAPERAAGRGPADRSRGARPASDLRRGGLLIETVSSSSCLTRSSPIAQSNASTASLRWLFCNCKCALWTCAVSHRGSALIASSHLMIAPARSPLSFSFRMPKFTCANA